MQDVGDLLRRAMRAVIVSAIVLYVLMQAAAMLGGAVAYSAAARSGAGVNAIPSYPFAATSLIRATYFGAPPL